MDKRSCLSELSGPCLSSLIQLQRDCRRLACVTGLGKSHSSSTCTQAAFAETIDFFSTVRKRTPLTSSSFRQRQDTSTFCQCLASSSSTQRLHVIVALILVRSRPTDTFRIERVTFSKFSIGVQCTKRIERLSNSQACDGRAVVAPVAQTATNWGKWRSPGKIFSLLSYSAMVQRMQKCETYEDLSTQSDNCHDQQLVTDEHIPCLRQMNCAKRSASM